MPLEQVNIGTAENDPNADTLRAAFAKVNALVAATNQAQSDLGAMVAALLACGLPAYQAAACAVYLHGVAADRAAAKRGEYGMLPHDILPELGALFAENQR